MKHLLLLSFLLSINSYSEKIDDFAIHKKNLTTIGQTVLCGSEFHIKTPQLNLVNKLDSLKSDFEIKEIISNGHKICALLVAK